MVDTPNKGYPLQATGANPGTWGVVVNTEMFSVVDLNLGGRNNKDVSGSSNITLTSGEAENIYQHLTGTLTGNIDYIFPATQGGDFIINNGTSGAYTVTAKPDGGTGIEIPQGATVRIFIDPDASAAVTTGVVLLATGSGLSYDSGLLTIATTARGDLIYRGASGNVPLPIGAGDTVLSTNGTDPSWFTVSDLLDAVISSTVGALAYRGSSGWRNLAPGTSGRFLETKGSGSAPTWSDLGSSDAAVHAWVSSSPATTIKQSYHVSSITRNAAGDFTINVSSSFSNTNWSAVATAGITVSPYSANLYSQTSSAARFLFFLFSGGSWVLFDPPGINFMGAGHS